MRAYGILSRRYYGHREQTYHTLSRQRQLHDHELLPTINLVRSVFGPVPLKLGMSAATEHPWDKLVISTKPPDQEPPMACCHHCQDAEHLFDQRDARQRLERYRRRGPEGTTQLLVAALCAAGVQDATVLDIGGGVGVVHHELLRAGAAQATDVDVSSAYLAAARSESVRQGHTAQVRYVHGDFVALAAQLDAADVVALDRVICCYPDLPALVGAAATRANHVLGLVYPRDEWWVRAGVRLVNLGFALQRSAFRIFCHPTAAVEAEVRKAGLRRLQHRTSGLWQVVVYVR